MELEKKLIVFKTELAKEIGNLEQHLLQMKDASMDAKAKKQLSKTLNEASFFVSELVS